MTSIRRFVYAAALTLSAFSFAPSLASAQESRGRFVLTHEVHWQNTVVPAGEYEFSFRPNGPTELLFVRKLSSSGTGFMMLVNDVTEAKPSGSPRIIFKVDSRTLPNSPWVATITPIILRSFPVLNQGQITKRRMIAFPSFSGLCRT